MKRQGSVRWGVLLWAVVASTVTWAAPPASAVSTGAPDEGGNPRVETELRVDVSQVKPGDTFRVGVHFRMDPGWYIYWKNPGDSGLSTEVSWDTPGVTVGELRWPFPSTYRTPDGFIVTHGYKEEVILFAEARASEQATGSLTLSAAVDALVCEQRCIPAEMLLSRSLPVGTETVRDAESTAAFDAAQSRVPLMPEAAGLTMALALDSEKLKTGQPFTGTLTVSASDGKLLSSVEPDFFVPERIRGIKAMGLTLEAPGRFRLQGEAAPNAPKEDPRLKGVLRLGSAQTGFQAVEVNLPLAPVEVVPVAMKPPPAMAPIAASAAAPQVQAVAPAGATACTCGAAADAAIGAIAGGGFMATGTTSTGASGRFTSTAWNPVCAEPSRSTPLRRGSSLGAFGAASPWSRKRPGASKVSPIALMPRMRSGTKKSGSTLESSFPSLAETVSVPVKGCPVFSFSESKASAIVRPAASGMRGTRD